MSGDFRVERGDFGPRAILSGAWRDSFASELRQVGCVELELNHAKGWVGADVEFLSALPWLQALAILDFRIKSVAPIHQLHELRGLRVLTYCKTRIDGACFPHLLDVGLEWREGAESLLDVVQLRSLYINRYPKLDLQRFSRLASLNRLTLLGARLRNLAGLERLVNLRYLRLGDLRLLAGLGGVSELPSLDTLELDTCPGISVLDDLGGAHNLRVLHLINCGRIASLAPLKGLKKLEVVLFYESTDIVDGNLEPLLSLPNLRNVVFMDRGHYSHRQADFPRARTGEP